MNCIVMAKGAGLGAWVDNDFAHARQIVYVPDDGGFEALENPCSAISSPSYDDEKALAEFILSKFPETHAVIAGSFIQKTREYFKSHNVATIPEPSGSVLGLVEKLKDSYLTRE